MRWITVRVERPPIEERLARGGHRRKSVRYEVSSWGMGFDMHNLAPEEERWDQLGPFLPSCISHSSFRARRKQKVIKRAATAPRTAPGKKPAARAPAGKEGQEVDSAEHVVEFVDFSDEGDGTGVIVSWGIVEVVPVVDDGDGTGVIVAWEIVEVVAVVDEESVLAEELETDDDVVVIEELDKASVAVVEVFWFREQVLSPWQV